MFELRPEGVTLVEIAPGIDLQTQVLDQMEFMPKIADDLKLMDERIFHEESDGSGQRLIEKRFRAECPPGTVQNPEITPNQTGGKEKWH